LSIICVRMGKCRKR